MWVTGNYKTLTNKTREGTPQSFHDFWDILSILSFFKKLVYLLSSLAFQIQINQIIMTLPNTHPLVYYTNPHQALLSALQLRGRPA